MNKYESIMYQDRPIQKRPRMSLDNRANIFAPFDALRGFSLAVLTKEQERQLVPKPGLSADAEDLIERKLRTLQPGDCFSLTRFQTEKKTGEYEIGTVLTGTARFVEVDLVERTMILTTGEVRLEDILDLQGCVFDLLEAS